MPLNRNEKQVTSPSAYKSRTTAVTQMGGDEHPFPKGEQVKKKPSSTTKMDILSSPVCSVCNLAGCDVRLNGCGCTLHILCCPLSLVLDVNVPLGASLCVGPIRNQNLPCEICKSGTVTGIEVLPLDFSPLKKAIKIRVAAAQGKSPDIPATSPPREGDRGTKRGREGDAANLEVEATHVVFSQGKQPMSTSLADSECHRTGRWAEEEVAFVDRVVTAFDRSQLPLPHGTKLSSFLGDILLCKASRLTKKMKNAKLSTRSYELRTPQFLSREDSTVLHTLQDKFVKSMPSEYAQLEMRFNLTKHWRSYFSDLCMQIGYPFLDGTDFIASLEEFERQSSLAEERMRNVRRRRMGFNVRHDLPHDIPLSSPVANMSKLQVPNLPPLKLEEQGESIPPTSVLCSSLDNQERKISDILVEMDSTQERNPGHVGTLAELENNFIDFTVHTDHHIEEDRHSLAGAGLFDIVPPQPKQVQGPFLEAIAMYLEQQDMPYQHADVWVPSFVGNGSHDEVRLLHAGYTTRRDQSNERWTAFENFGEYSKAFTFLPGMDLVGRVYSTGRTLWEFEIDELNAKGFLRASGAHEYGVRTATGLPFSTPGVGRMVVILYSCDHMKENAALALQCAQDLSRYSPEPKWKLVIEIGQDTGTPKSHGIGENAGPEESKWISNFSKSTSSLPSSSASLVDSSDSAEVGEIISLLGEQLAVQSRSLSQLEDMSTSSDEGSNLFHDFMSIRLMLLRPANRRTTEENEMIDVLRSSYRAYSAGNLRKGCELATLLVREWLCLSGSQEWTKRSMSSSKKGRPQGLPPREHDSTQPQGKNKSTRLSSTGETDRSDPGPTSLSVQSLPPSLTVGPVSPRKSRSISDASQSAKRKMAAAPGTLRDGKVLAPRKAETNPLVADI